jgi:hypothetical protein
MNKDLMKRLSFMTMGDGGVYDTHGNGRFKFIMNMVEDNEDYVQLCAKYLSEVTSVKIKKVQKEGNRRPQLRLETAVHPVFGQLRQRIYCDKYKSLDWHAMKALDWEAMSFLYMSDGSLQKYLRPEIGMVNPSYKLTLNLKRLCYADLLELKRAIRDVLGVEFNINKQHSKTTGNTYYYLTLRTKDVRKFVENIKPYICESFKYKVEL